MLDIKIKYRAGSVPRIETLSKGDWIDLACPYGLEYKKVILSL